MGTHSAAMDSTAEFSRFFRELASGVPGMLYCYQISADGQHRHFPFISNQVRTLFALEPDELRRDARSMVRVLHPEDREQLMPSIYASARHLTPWYYQARMQLRSGDYHWFESHGMPRRREDGGTVWFGQFTDIQNHKDLEFELRARESEAAYQLRFHQLMAKLSSGFINSAIGDIDRELDRFLALTGEFFQVDRVYLYRFSEDFRRMSNSHEWCLPGVPELKSSQQSVDISGFDWWQRQIQTVLSKNRVVYLEEIDNLPEAAGNERQLLQEQGVKAMFCVPILVRGVLVGFYGMDSLHSRQWRVDLGDLLILLANILSQALERSRLEEELLYQSTRDPLTGIHNRRYLEPRLDEAIALYRRTGKGFAVAMLDIDHFKQVNDTLGHQAGDQVLRRFGRLLAASCRGADVAARYGGEEFAVVFAGATPEKARQALVRILEQVRDMDTVFRGERIPVTISAGLVHVSDLAELTPDTLITEADRRLYRAKRTGRDCLVDGQDLSPLQG